MEIPIKPVGSALLHGRLTYHGDLLAKYFKRLILFQMFVYPPLFPINFITDGMGVLFSAEEIDGMKERYEEEWEEYML